MAIIRIDVPKDKMQSFVQEILRLGLDARGIMYKRHRKTLLQKKKLAYSLQKISSSFILFDWEYFSNELEYE